MKRIFHKARSFKDAELWDIKQQTGMTPEERIEAARRLKEIHYGTSAPDVRDKVQ